MITIGIVLILITSILIFIVYAMAGCAKKETKESIDTEHEEFCINPIKKTEHEHKTNNIRDRVSGWIHF